MMDCWSMLGSAPPAGSTSIEVKIPTKPELGSTFLQELIDNTDWNTQPSHRLAPVRPG